MCNYSRLYNIALLLTRILTRENEAENIKQIFKNRRSPQ